MKIVLIGGHSTPLIAVAQELKKSQGAEIVSISRLHTMEGDSTPSKESAILEQFGSVYFITAGRLQRRLTKYFLLSLLKIPLGFWQSIKLLHKIKPSVVVSFGGYLSVPVVLAAWLLDIPCITHEQSVKAGLANRINARFVKKIAVSFKTSQAFFPAKKTVLTGNPIRSSIFNTTAQTSAIASFLATPTLPLIYITGGNQGSQVINQTVFALLTKLLVNYKVLHQTGSANGGHDLGKAKQLKIELAERGRAYYPVDFIHDPDIGAVYHTASLLVSRAGANTVAEILALNKKAILVPIPWAQNNEQEENAKLVVTAKLGIIIRQHDLTPQRLLSAIEDLGSGPLPQSAPMANNAAQDLASLIVSFVK